MIRLYAYIYYRIYYYYVSKNEREIPGIYALAAVSLIQIFNAMTLVFATLYLNSFRWHPSKWWALLSFFLIILVNYFVLMRSNYAKELIDKWKQQEHEKLLKQKRGYFVLLYIIISFIVGIYSAVLFSPKNW